MLQIERWLNLKLPCQCGRTHRITTRYVTQASPVERAVRTACQGLGLSGPAILVMDENTGRAAFFQFQERLQADPQTDSEAYAKLMQTTLGWKHTNNDAAAYLMTNDDYRSGGRVLGMVIALQIRDQLRQEWGEDWYAHPDLAERLAAGAAGGLGQKLSDFLDVWGITAVDPGVLVAQAGTE